MKVVKKIEIDYGHRICNHTSKCFSPHGHRGVIEVCLSGDTIDDKTSSSDGMVIDFSDIKNGLIQVVENKYDHSFIVSHDDPIKDYLIEFVDESVRFDDGERKFKVVVIDRAPTAENLSQIIFTELSEFFKNTSVWKHLRLEWVKFFETPNSWAITNVES